MSQIPPGLALPKSLDQIDAAFMTKVLRHGDISATNKVVAQEEEGVGMTAGYFSAIKKVRCALQEATDAQDVVRGQGLAAVRDPAEARLSGRCSSRISRPTHSRWPVLSAPQGLSGRLRSGRTTAGRW